MPNHMRSVLGCADQGDNTNVLMDVATKHTGYTQVAIEVTDIQSVQPNRRFKEEIN